MDYQTMDVTKINTKLMMINKDGRCAGLTALPPSYPDYLEILGSSTSGNNTGLFRPESGMALHNAVVSIGRDMGFLSTETDTSDMSDVPSTASMMRKVQ
jgi:hypothetical protein